MAAAESRPPVQPGEAAPDFTLPAASGEGSVSLSQYRGKSPVYLALFRGLYCSFCRRHVVQLGSIAQKLQEEGIQTLGVVATDHERARFYFRYRPPRMPMGADPELRTHRAYGLPNFPLTSEAMDVGNAAAARELRRMNQPVPAEPLEAFRKLDGYEATPADEADFHRHQAQLIGTFLVDRDGMVCHAYVECAQGGLTAFGEMPSAEEILASARGL
jgi:peroxiredoxin